MGSLAERQDDDRVPVIRADLLFYASLGLAACSFLAPQLVSDRARGRPMAQAKPDHSADDGCNREQDHRHETHEPPHGARAYWSELPTRRGLRGSRDALSCRCPRSLMPMSGAFLHSCE